MCIGVTERLDYLAGSVAESGRGCPKQPWSRYLIVHRSGHMGYIVVTVGPLRENFFPLPTTADQITSSFVSLFGRPAIRHIRAEKKRSSDGN